MQIREVLDVKPAGEIHGIDPDATVAQAVARMVERGIGSLVVTPEDSVDYVRDAMTKSHTSHLAVLDGNKLAGVISFHDVARACLKEANFENALLKRYIKHWPE